MPNVCRLAGTMITYSLFSNVEMRLPYGVWRYGKYVAQGGKGGKRLIDEQIPVNVPAIISREAWEFAQERRSYNSRVARRKMKREYLLRGLIYCGCGRGMVGSGRGAEQNSYHY